jgi:hypothetical protein
VHSLQLICFPLYELGEKGMKKIKNGLMLATLCAASVYSQGISVTAPKVTVTAPVVAVPAAPAVADTAAVAPSVPAVEHTVIDSAAAIVPAVAAPEVPPAPAVVAPAVPAVPAAPVAPAVPAPLVVASEPLSIKYHLGSRLGLGISALRGHVALRVVTLENNNQVIVPVELRSAFSLGFGVAFGIEINDLLTVAPELQYTLYRANGATHLKTGGVPYQEEAGIRLHAFELPILARFNFSSPLGALYAEVGPQIGYNAEATSYKNDDNRKVQVNSFAFGPSLGFGTKIDGILLGIRGHLGVLEYAENTKGYPWVVQISVTKFFF